MSDPKSNTAISKVDPHTGKVLTVRGPLDQLKPPKKETVTPLATAVGKNLPINKFEDHPEWNGMDLLTADDPYLFAFQDGLPDDQGRKTEFVTFTAWICSPGKEPQSEPVIIRTGARNAYERLLNAYMNDALPVRASIRYVPTRRGKSAIFLD